MAIRVLSDPDLEARLIAEAHEHVRRFDWTDIAAADGRPSTTT